MNKANIKFMQEWLANFDRKARDSGDTERKELLELFDKMAGLDKDGPDQVRLDMCEEGQMKARELNEPWFELLFIHGKMMARRELQDFTHAIDEAIRAMNLLSKEPGYVLAGCTYHDLVAANQEVDPSTIDVRTTLAEMENTITEDDKCRQCINLCWVKQHLFENDLDNAHRHVTIQMEENEKEENEKDRKEYKLAYCQLMCLISLRRENWSDLNKWVRAMQGLVNYGAEAAQAEAWMWWAVNFRVRGSKQSITAYKQGLKKIKQSKNMPHSRYHDAHVAYHEVGEDIESAIQVRLDQYENIQRRGMKAVEFEILVDICRLKKMIGEDYATDLEQASDMANGFSRPEVYLDKLRGFDRKYIGS